MPGTRVLYFTRDYTTHDHRFLASLADNGYEVNYLRLERRGRQIEDRPLPPSVRQVQWRGGQKPFRWADLPALLNDLRRVIRTVQPDILHAGPVQTCAFLAALSGFHPQVTMSWGSDLLKDAERSRPYRWITRYTLLRSDALVGDCEAVREKAVSLGYPAGRVFLFPWGIDLAQFSPGSAEDLQPAQAFRARAGWQDCFVVLSNRSWEPVYGVDIALRGFAQAAQEAPDLRLLLLGGGSLAPMVHQLIRKYDLADRVFLGGQVTQSELARVYRSADLYVSASHSDGSSVSLMEALACGKPALVSNIPGNREWVTPGVEGWLFPDGDAQALAEAILKAYQHRAELGEIGARARAAAERRADWQKNFQVLRQAYASVLAAGPQNS